MAPEPPKHDLTPGELPLPKKPKPNPTEAADEQRKQDAWLVREWVACGDVVAQGSPNQSAMSLFSGNQLAILRYRAQKTLETMIKAGITTESQDHKLVVGETGLEVRHKEPKESGFLGGDQENAAIHILRAQVMDILLEAIEGPLGVYPAMYTRLVEVIGHHASSHPIYPLSLVQQEIRKAREVHNTAARAWDFALDTLSELSTTPRSMDAPSLDKLTDSLSTLEGNIHLLGTDPYLVNKGKRELDFAKHLVLRQD